MSGHLLGVLQMTDLVREQAKVVKPRSAVVGWSAPARLLAGLVYGALADMAADFITREEPSLGSVHSPPVAQDLQQLWRKHDIAVDAPFALFDSDNHSCNRCR